MMQAGLFEAERDLCANPLSRAQVRPRLKMSGHEAAPRGSKAAPLTSSERKKQFGAWHQQWLGGGQTRATRNSKVSFTVGDQRKTSAQVYVQVRAAAALKARREASSGAAKPPVSTEGEGAAATRAKEAKTISFFVTQATVSTRSMAVRW